MVTTKVTWKCDICGHEWSTQREAEACEALGTPPQKFSVGQSVDVVNEIWGPAKILATQVRGQRVLGKPTHQRRYVIILNRSKRWYSEGALELAS